jgi:hypothetical protein
MKRSHVLFLCSSALCLLEIWGCGGGGVSDPSTPERAISVALTPNSAQALDANQSDSLTATVNNDSGHQGVNWTVTCPAGVSACGTMAQAKTSSGVANQYIGPASVSAVEAVTVTATSVSDASKSVSVQVMVNPALALVSPAPAQPQPGLVGAAFSFNLMSFVQGGTAPFTWGIKSGTLPAGLALDAKTGLITGTPTTATSTAVAIVFTLRDSGNPATTLPANPQISLAINAPVALTVTSGAPPDGTMNVTYGPSQLGTLRCVWQHHFLGGVIFQLVCTPCPSPSACGSLPLCTSNITISPCRKSGVIFPGFTLTAIGGVPTYTWSLATGSALPPGLNLTSTGTVVGTPTQFGTFTFTLTVSDSASPIHHTSATYTININPPPPPVIDALSPLPIGTLNSPYVGFTFTATDGLPPFDWTATGLPPGISLSSAGGLSGTPTSTGSFPVTVQVQDAASQNSAPVQTTIQVLAKGFSPTASMGTARVWHTATLLANGKVLISGGVNTTAPITTAELYDSVTAKFSQTTGSPIVERFSATATLLNNGKVLLIGGKGADGELATADLYDPATETFAATTGNMSTERAYHTATLLGDGTVLVSGGLNLAGDTNGTPVASAEIYDPATASFTLLAASMSTGRFFHTATLLGNGKVLITGGASNGTSSMSAELYDPATKTFTPTGNLTVAREGHASTLLNSGRVLLTGGAATFAGDSTTTAELYDPGTGSFTATNSMTSKRSAHSATLLKNGQVLLAGGSAVFYGGGESNSLSSAELFDPTTGSFTATADMTAVRESHTSTLLGGGQVLVVGGANGTLGYTPTIVLATAELRQ